MLDSTSILIIEVLLLVLVAGVCSGLNIALMSLDPADLRRKAKLGNRQAKRVLPLRQHTHLTLASILLTNVAVVSACSLVLEQQLNGLLAGIISTLLMVVFGEIMPQALFSKNALAWTSLFAPLLKAMIAFTYVLSKPLQLLLDTLFPRQRSKLQSRQELGLLVNEHFDSEGSELDADEIEIMRGALSLSEKRVRDIMTDIRHTYWLTPSTVLDEAKLQEIKEHAYSRIPVFNKSLTKCYGILLMKNLIDVDFEKEQPQVDDLPLYPVQLVGSMTALDTMFRKFISTGTHLISIERDDQIVGVATIEDLLEEIVGHEIEDETDREKAARAER
ncbi:MAG TPA: CNNM domain-containing protein [Candidatus Saccharimonadales bacterium]|nr:CNNM domain-containing protein [Candidatus Saccharimonadales bacterium]